MLSGSSRFQPGEGPSRGLLRDYKPSDHLRMQLFEALGSGDLQTIAMEAAGPGSSSTPVSQVTSEHTLQIADGT